MSQPFSLNAEALLLHRDFLRGLARGLLADEAGVEDVVQEAYVRALERPPRSEEALRSWLARVVQNLARNRLRGERRRAAREQSVARTEAVPSSAEVAARLGVQRRVVDAVLGLSEPYLTVIYLRWYEGLPPREIARRLARPVETVRSQIKRGLALLRAELDRELGDRRAWTLALLPLAGVPRAAEPALRPMPVAAGHLPAALALLALAAGTALVALLATRGREGGTPPTAPRGAIGARGGAALASGVGREATEPVDGARSSAAVGAGERASGPAPVAGRVVRARTAEPVAELLVCVADESGAAEEVLTDAAGFFRSARSFEPGRVRLAFRDGPERTLVGERVAAHRSALGDEPAVHPGDEPTIHEVELGPCYRLDVEPPPGVGLGDLRARLEDPVARRAAERAALRPGPLPWVRFAAAPGASLMDTGGRSMYALFVESADGLWGGVVRVHAETGTYPDVLPVRLAPRGVLSGRVQDERGAGVAGADVRLVPEAERAVAARTDGEGGFRLAALAPGRCTLRVGAPRFAPIEELVTIAEGEAVELALELRALPCAAIEGLLASTSGRHVPLGRVHLASAADPALVFTAEPVAIEPEGGAVRHAFRFDVPAGEYELKPPMEDGFAWRPASLRVQVPGPAAAFECLDDAPLGELAFRAFDERTGAPIESFRTVVLVDRYRLGIRRAAAFEPELAPRPARFGESAARVPEGVPLAWVVEAEGYRSAQGGRAELAREEGRLVADVRLAPSWKARLWIGARDESGAARPLAGARVRTSGGKLLATSLGDGEARLELLYDPGRLAIELDGWRVASWEGFAGGRRRAELDLHRVWMERVPR